MALEWQINICIGGCWYSLPNQDKTCVFCHWSWWFHKTYTMWWKLVLHYCTPDMTLKVNWRVPPLAPLHACGWATDWPMPLTAGLPAQLCSPPDVLEKKKKYCTKIDVRYKSGGVSPPPSLDLFSWDFSSFLDCFQPLATLVSPFWMCGIAIPISLCVNSGTWLHLPDSSWSMAVHSQPALGVVTQRCTSHTGQTHVASTLETSRQLGRTTGFDWSSDSFLGPLLAASEGGDWTRHLTYNCFLNIWKPSFHVCLDFSGIWQSSLPPPPHIQIWG